MTKESVSSSVRWRPISSVVAEAARSPYLLASQERSRVEKILKGRGFQVAYVETSELRSEGEISLAVGQALEYPEFFRGGWDGFFDLLSTEFQDRPRILVVGLLDSDKLAYRDLRLFVNTSWHLFNATETVGSEGEGEWQLEFLYWGDWRRWGSEIVS